MKLYFFPDPESSLLISSAEDKKAKVWDLTISKQVRELEGHSDIVSAFATTNDKAYLITGDRDGSICFWKVKSGFEKLSTVTVGEAVGALVYLSLKTTQGLKSYLIIGDSSGILKTYDI